MNILPRLTIFAAAAIFAAADPTQAQAVRTEKNMTLELANQIAAAAEALAHGFGNGAEEK
jgi:hypothetical protein